MPAKSPEAKAKRRAYMTRYRDSHRDDARRHQAEYRARHPNRMRAYYQAHREEFLQRCKEYYREHRLEYLDRMNARRKTGYAPWIAYQTRRAEWERGKVDYAAVLERDGYICHLCGEPVTPEELHFDHVMPLSRGGEHSEGNLAVSHAHCNMSKGNRVRRNSKNTP